MTSFAVLDPQRVNLLEQEVLLAVNGQSDAEILRGLKHLSHGASHFGCPKGQSPAIVTNLRNEVVAIDTLGVAADPVRIPLVRALTALTKNSNGLSPEAMPNKLFILGKDHLFDGMGPLNSFAPSQVIVLNDESIEVPFSPGHADYFDVIKKERGVNVTFVTLEDLRGNTGVSLDTTFTQQKENNNIPSEDPHGFLLDSNYRVYNKLISDFSKSIIDNKLEKTVAKKIMSALHLLAKRNVDLGGGPFAAAIFSPDGDFVALGSNRVVPNKDPLMHGEVSAIQRALDESGRKDLNGFIMLTSAQTCISCAETAARVGLKTIIYGNTKDDIEQNTIFTEGPLADNFFENNGIHQYALSNSTDLEAFSTFMEKIGFDPRAAYLKKKEISAPN